MPMVDYAVNYNIITKKLCENKNRPQLLCNGKCYLKKELAKASGQQTKTDSRINISGFTDIFIINDDLAFAPLMDTISESSNALSEFSFSYRFNLLSDIFHPPLA